MRVRGVASTLAGIVVGLTVIAAMPGLSVSGGGGVQAMSVAPPQTAATWTSLDYEFSDFFDVPWGEFWDYRLGLYGDRPFNAECFSQGAIDSGDCTASDPAVPDVSSYPYMNWYPGVGAISPSNPNANPWVQGPYRFAVQGADVTGYTLAEPVYFPVLAPSAAAGTRLDFDWRMQYITKAQAADMSARGCPGVGASSLDGYHIQSQITLTMDLQESRRLFGVVGADVAAARTWWQTHTDSTCLGVSDVETGVETWFGEMGGLPRTLGKYDIYNSFEWFLQTFFTEISASVANNGVTTVMINHVAWGTEVLLARMFYWGSASYIANYLDSTQALGWWGMELGWFEDVAFTGSFSPTDHDFNLAAVMQYHLVEYSFPGPDGMWDRQGDESYWQWGPVLTDYVNNFSPFHLISELDRIPGKTYVRTAPGHRSYGSALLYDYTPHTWNLKEGETHVFRLPTREITFHDPNLTPLGADPKDEYVGTNALSAASSLRPTGYGTYDAATNTLTVTGPTTTGGPLGTPGPDGTPGTADDQYPLDPYPGIILTPRRGPGLLRATTNPAVPGKILVDGIPRDEWGLTWVKLNPGPVTVSFGDVYGLSTPAPQAVVIASGATTEVPGNYVVHGSLRVTTEPALPSTISINGQPANDWGMWRSVPPGDYTVSWGAVAGYTPPAPVTVTIASGGFMQVPGVFTANPSAPGPDPATYGLLRVTTNPAVHSQISANGIPRDEWGLTWVKLAPGMYTVSFKGVYGFTTPAPMTVEVLPNGETTPVEGVFAQHGSLRITTSGALSPTVSVDGVPRNDWGMWQSMPPGTYTVSYETIPGYTTPADDIVTVTAGALATADGPYVASAAAEPDATPLGAPDGYAMPGPRIATVAGSSRE